ncbi:MAG: putative metal-dependent HD superfamily phosphohydrolase [Urechidicola sp.]|jgi:predicted metal-dependent HD superfamily phosphohydrolase
MLENDFFIGIKNYVSSLLKDKLPVEVVYHNFDHTSKVVEAAGEIGTGENLNEEEMEIVLTAAWFHDLGFVVGPKNHEEESKRIAQNYLSEVRYSKDKIAQVLSCIDATKMPQNPQNKLEKVVSDADLFHLGSEGFSSRSSLLRSEWELLCKETFDDIAWLEKNEKFIIEHKFYTDYAYQKMNEQKTINRLKIQKDLKKALVKKQESIIKEKQKLEDNNRKKLKENRSDRGIETMYRVTLKNHIKLSDIADTKANILLSVSAIVLSIVLSTLFPKLDKPDNYYLIYPTLFFLITTVVTMVFSILSTRPKVTTGKFSKEDVKNKKVNLLFFGNFHKMELEDFQEGMQQIMDDRDYLYKSLMKDLYFLGIVLDRKYKILRTAYTIFMFGIIISVISFIIAFQLMRIATVV